MMELITDRTQTDVDYGMSLYNKDGGWDNFTDEEKDYWLNQPVKGRYGTKDYERVSNAVNILNTALAAAGYDTGITTIKTDWPNGYIPTPEDLQTYIFNITAIKNTFYGITPLPAGWNYPGYDDANNIERLLLEVEARIDLMTGVYRHSGTFYSGQGGLRA